ncbi:zinc ribbon domain-containing protein [Oscillatoria laete-virens NRMC-F 0139]|nr:zinc ribbon domain-containing protein [Oscillatoria laete-virens]MDL5052288.1 zinc ribbon domain-containing protein [Oscillatoria laete-virens NRMC-F 0139]
MPLYDFRCGTCGNFEKWRSLAELSTPMHCPQCNAVAQRLFSPPMILTGNLRLRNEQPEPKRVQRTQEPETPRNREHRGSRPWMIGH